MAKKLRLFFGLFLLCLFLAGVFNVPEAKSETGEQDDTPRERQAVLWWNNLTALQVNGSFPFCYLGSSSATDVAEAQFLSGAIVGLQQGNGSYLVKGDELCEYLDSTVVYRLFHQYNTTSKTWLSSQFGLAARNLMEMAVFANVSVEWKPLLGEVAESFIDRFINASTYRVYSKVDYDGTVVYSYSTAHTTSYAIIGLTLAADVLDNDTIRETAYRVLTNYSLGTVNLPYHQIYQSGAAKETYCKVDENFGLYTLAMCCYYNYFQNTTVKNRINNVTKAFYKYGWHTSAKRWNYTTNADTGATVSGIGVHGFGYTDEAFLQAYLIWKNATWLPRMRQDMDTMVLDGAIIGNGLIMHNTGGASDADDQWNVAARRTMNMFYNFNYSGFYQNSTYLTKSIELYTNASLAHERSLTWQMKVNVADYTDYTGIENTASWFIKWLQYVNQTDVIINTLADLYRYFGAPNVGNMFSAYNLWNFYGVFDENTGLLKSAASRAVNVTAYYSSGIYTETFEVNGSYAYYTFSETPPLYFRMNTTSPREYWLDPLEETADIYIFDDGLTTYTIHFLDLAGALKDYPYVVAKRYVNGSLMLVEKRKVDVENKIQASFKQGVKYTIVIENGASYVFGDYLFTSTTTVELTLKGIEFPKETLLTYKYVRIYATRAFGTPNGNITITYEDTLEMTTSVAIYINYKNGTNAYNTTLYTDSFSYTYPSALNSTDYALVVNIVHERYGSYTWKQYFPMHLSTNPWGLDWFGISLPFPTEYIIPFFLIVFVGGCFTVINAEVGAFMMVVAAVIVCYMWALPISSSALIVSFTLAILMAIIYAKRKVQT